jgi:hypothetical protein
MYKRNTANGTLQDKLKAAFGVFKEINYDHIDNQHLLDIVRTNIALKEAYYTSTRKLVSIY